MSQLHYFIKRHHQCEFSAKLPRGDLDKIYRTLVEYKMLPRGTQEDLRNKQNLFEYINKNVTCQGLQRKVTTIVQTGDTFTLGQVMDSPHVRCGQYIMKYQLDQSVDRLVVPKDLKEFSEIIGTEVEIESYPVNPKMATPVEISVKTLSGTGTLNQKILPEVLMANLIFQADNSWFLIEQINADHAVRILPCTEINWRRDGQPLMPMRNPKDTYGKIFEKLKAEKISDYPQLDPPRIELSGMDRELTDAYNQMFLPIIKLGMDKLRELQFKPQSCAILHGPPGTGKTLFAQTLAHRVKGAKVILVRGPELRDKYVGETERKIRELFDVSKTCGGPLVVIIDEIDSLIGRRDSGSTHQVDQVNQVLSIIGGAEDYPNLFVLGTTNRMDSLDPAAVRAGRFDLHIEIGLPNAETRDKILRQYFEPLVNQQYVTGVDYAKLVSWTSGKSGADIASYARKCLIQSLSTETSVDLPDLRKMMETPVAKVDHMLYI